MEMDKQLNGRIVCQFMGLTFLIAYSVAGILIFFVDYGYSVNNWIHNIQQFLMNVPFSIYILSPAIACYLVLRRNNKISGFWEWTKTVFQFRNNGFPYFYVLMVLGCYFGIHVFINDDSKMIFPLYHLIYYLPGALFIGGLEEAGWMYILQPFLYEKYGFIRSSLFSGFIWTLWHIPLFFIAGTNHGDGKIDFIMFVIQLFSFRFIHGAIYKLSGKSVIFMSILFHTLFNAISPVFGDTTMTWTGTLIANSVLVCIAIVTVYFCDRNVDKSISIS